MSRRKGTAPMRPWRLTMFIGGRPYTTTHGWRRDAIGFLVHLARVRLWSREATGAVIWQDKHSPFRQQEIRGVPKPARETFCECCPGIICRNAEATR